MATIYKEVTTYSSMSENCTDYEPFSGTFGVPPGYFGLHCHDFFEFYIFFKGVPYFFLNEQVFSLKPCTLIILPPFHMHGVINTQEASSCDYERSWLYVTPAMMQTIGMGIHNFADFFTECVQTGRAYFNIDYDTAESCRKIIENICRNMTVQNQMEKWQNYLYVAEFISKIYNIAHVSDATSKPIILNKTIQAVLGYINNNFTEAISIPELSRRFGISVSYMAREFTMYTGRSVYDYVLYRRILLAKQLICAGKPFTETAYECGFNDYSGFLRAFGKLTGQTPRAYKKYIKSIGNLS